MNEFESTSVPFVECPECGWRLEDNSVSEFRRDLKCMNGAKPECDAELEYGRIITIREGPSYYKVRETILKMERP